MSRRCIAAGCDNVGGKGCSLHKFSQDKVIRKKWIKAVKQQRSNWNGPSPHFLLHMLKTVFGQMLYNRRRLFS